MGTVGIGYYQISSIDHTYTNLIKDKAHKLIMIKDLVIAVKQEQVSMRGYLITGDEASFQNFTNAQNEYQNTYGELLQIIVQPKAVQLLKEADQLEKEYSQFANRTFELKRQNKTNEYRNLVATQGRDIVNRFSEKVTELAQFQEGLLEKGNQEATATVDTVKNLVLILGIAAVLLGFVIALFIGRIISRPVIAIAEAAEKIASGNLTADDIKVKNRDEVGILANSFNQMARNLRQLIHQVGSNAEQVAASAEELTASAEQKSNATEQIAKTMQEIATGVDKQVQNVEETYQTVNEMTRGVQQIATNAQGVSSTALETAEKASEGGQVIQSAVDQMNSIQKTIHRLAVVIEGLGKRSKEIGQIIEVITGIAAQTNLLALNAAIEAARAGEHGRGFAVVADEVRKLAEQSAGSAQKISQLISTIQEETNRAVQSMEVATAEVETGIGVANTAGKSFAEIENSINEVTSQIQEVSSAVQQMSAGAEQMVNAMQMITQVSEETAAGTQEVSAATEEQLASMEEISSSACSLSKMAEDLQMLIGRFKV